MNIRTTLMLMAATVASPLSAQQPADVYTALAATSTATATVEQRAAAMPALTVIPADCEACYTFTNFTAFIDNLRRIGAIDAEDYEYMPDEIKAINSIALAGGKGSNKLVANALNLFNSCRAYEMIEVVETMVEGTAPEYSDTIAGELLNAKDAALQNFKNLLAETKISPAYGVLTVNAGYESMIAEWYAQLSETLKELAEEEDGVELVELQGYSGLKLNMPEEEATPGPYDSVHEIAISEEVVKRTLYVLFKLEGDKIISVVCENPEEINTAATPQESILGTNKLAQADAKLDNGLFMAAYGSPELLDDYTNASGSDIRTLGRTIENVFNALAAKGDANQAVFTATAKGINTLLQSWDKLTTASITRPALCLVSWNKSAIDIDFTFDHVGYTIKPAKLSLLNKAADPDTILYFESGYMNSNLLPDAELLVDTAMTITEGIIATTPKATQNALSMQVGMAKAFLPELKDALKAFSTISEGLDNSAALIVDKGATMPAILGGAAGNTTAFPRVALYSGVSDRSKLSSGWDSLLATAGKIAEKAGQNPGIVNMLPIVPKIVGKATSYSVAMPWFSENLVPNLTVSDSAFIIGTSSALNAELAETATGTLDFSGAVCTLKTAPLASLLRSIADDMENRAEAESAQESKAIPATPAVVIEDDEEEVEYIDEESDEEDYEEGDYVDEDDFDEEDIYSYHYVEPSPAERRARNFSGAADMAQGLSEYVDSINMIYSTGEQDARLRIEFKMR